MPLFRVSIRYREPTYETWHGSGPRPYEGGFVIEAPSSDEAIAQALREFRVLERLSGVSWPREVEGVDVEPERGGGPPGAAP